MEHMAVACDKINEILAFTATWHTLHIHCTLQFVLVWLKFQLNSRNKKKLIYLQLHGFTITWAYLQWNACECGFPYAEPSLMQKVSTDRSSFHYLPAPLTQSVIFDTQMTEMQTM